MPLYLVRVVHHVPVWASAPEEAERLAAGCWHLADYDCDPAAMATPDEGACEPDEVPIGGRGRPLSALLEGLDEAPEKG